MRRRIEGCRWPAGRCANRVHIALARSEAPRTPTGFPDPVSTSVCPFTVLGFPRVSGGTRFRSCFRGRSRTPVAAPPSLSQVNAGSSAYPIRLALQFEDGLNLAEWP